MTLLEAFDRWVSLRPFKKWESQQTLPFMRDDGSVTHIIELARWEGSCCGSGYTSHEDPVTGFILPDDRVCARERAWRVYCRIRDGVEIV